MPPPPCPPPHRHSLPTSTECTRYCVHGGPGPGHLQSSPHPSLHCLSSQAAPSQTQQHPFIGCFFSSDPPTWPCSASSQHISCPSKVACALLGWHFHRLGVHPISGVTTLIEVVAWTFLARPISLLSPTLPMLSWTPCLSGVSLLSWEPDPMHTSRPSASAPAPPTPRLLSAAFVPLPARDVRSLPLLTHGPPPHLTVTAVMVPGPVQMPSAGWAPPAPVLCGYYPVSPSPMCVLT